MTLDWPTIQWLIGIGVSITGSLLGVALAIWRAAGWVSGEFAKRDTALAGVKADAVMAVQAESARAKMAEDEVHRALEAHRLYAAEHFATEEGMAKAMEPILKAIDRLTDRLDRLIPEFSNTRPPPRTRG